ncbi:MAG TPA: sigma-54-dependent Fis family transcriptional regulator [Deltaproteobacteria bacterium]|nr:sigma-54-dependent Fis family transcriptional regulator [Deltaproteobacteria bacterium]
MAEDKFRVLITEDDASLQELLAEAVRNWGYEVAVAGDGEAALAELKRESYDIVVTDLMMPGMDGLQLLHKIKGLDREIMVIIITGYATLDTAVKAIEAGAYDYMAKPFRLDELMIVIKNACERLRLVKENRALLDELRAAYGEIAMLKKGRGDDGAAAAASAAGLSASDRSGAAMRQRKYLSEMDEDKGKGKRKGHLVEA